MNKLAFSAFLLLFPAFVFSKQTHKIPTGFVYDIIIRVKDKAIDNPFDYSLQYELTSPGGERVLLNTFYNGGDEWIFRFCPDVPGIWQAVCIEGSPARRFEELEFQVSDVDTTVRGPIEVDPDTPQRLRYANGDAYNMLAYELDWLFALDYGDEELPQSEKLLETIRQFGFNKVIMNVYAYDYRNIARNVYPDHEYGAKLDIFPFIGNNEYPDYSRLNVGFFQHLDKVMALLNGKDIVSHLMIYVWNKKVNWPEPGSAADNMFFDYVVKRYQAYPNLIWDISKEALSYGQDDVDYISGRISRLRALDVHDRLVTVHDYGYCARNPEKVDIISVQHWGTELRGSMLQATERFPGKPVFNIEHGGYEACQYDVFPGNYSNPEVCLHRNYLCLFAGVYSTYYWQCSSWDVIISDPFADVVEPKPKFEYYKYLRTFMDHWEFDKLRPVNGFSASGFALKHEADDQYIFLVPAENSAIDIKNLPESESLQLQWFNTLDGSLSEVEELEWSSYFRLMKRNPEGDDILIITLGQ